MYQLRWHGYAVPATPRPFYSLYPINCVRHADCVAPKTHTRHTLDTKHPFLLEHSSHAHRVHTSESWNSQGLVCTGHWLTENFRGNTGLAEDVCNHRPSSSTHSCFRVRILLDSWMLLLRQSKAKKKEDSHIRIYIAVTTVI